MLLRTTLVSSLLLLLLVEDSDERRRQSISARTWEKLKNVKSTEDFIMRFIKKKAHRGVPQNAAEKKAEEVENLLFVSHANTPSQAAATQVSGQIAVNDACEPKMVSVKIPQTDPSVLLWPTCTKLNRCAGCCGSSIYQCTPTKKVNHSLAVMQCQPSAPGSDDFNVIGIQPVSLEEHLACECQCKTKQEHCDRNKHIYLQHECRCKCRNEADAGRCRTPKKWDDKTCSCKCREVYNCHPEENFSHENCRCEMKARTGGQSGSSSSSNRCATLSCQAGFVKQPYMGSCRCVQSSGINVQQGNMRQSGAIRPSVRGRPRGRGGFHSG